MTDFTGARNVKCKICGEWFCDVDGTCGCFTCEICGEGFIAEWRREVKMHTRILKSGKRVFDTDLWCDACAEEHAVRCDECGDYWTGDLAKEFFKDGLCPDCQPREGET